MKKDLYEILDTLTPEELDTLPEELFQAKELDDVTLKRIQTAVTERTGITAPAHKGANRKANALRRILTAAACMALLLGAGAGACAYTAAKKECKNALTFFYEQNLSTEGLTKNEIKEVYRDFYSHSFTSDLTTDVLINSRPELVRGYEITGEASEWDSTPPDTSLSEYKTPVYYEYRHIYNETEGDKKYSPDESIFEKYKNGEKVWEVSFRDFTIYDYYGNLAGDTDPVLVYGTGLNPADSGDEIVTLIALDTDGAILWEAVQNNAPGFDQIDTVLAHPDGSYTTLGRCASDNKDLNYCLCVNKYDKNGTPLFSNTIDISDHFIKNATLTGSGYLVLLSSYVTIEYSRILMLDSEGNLLGDFRYESEENDFFISDLCEYNNTVYISGYATPKAPEKYRSYRSRNIYALRNNIYDMKRSGKSLTHDALLTLFREHFTAVLLVCGPDAGTPQEFYSVAGSIGDEVYVADGSVCWFTKDIIDCSYSPQETNHVGYVTSQETHTALCRFYANTFNADGTFKEQKKLDLMTELRWPK